MGEGTFEMNCRAIVSGSRNEKRLQSRERGTTIKLPAAKPNNGRGNEDKA